MIVAPPTFTPLICGCEAGWDWPAAMNTVEGDTVAMLVLVLERVTVTPPLGAGVESVTGNAAVCASWTLVVPGTPMLPGLATVMFAVADGTFCADAVITAVPAVTPVTGTLTELAFAGMKIVDVGSDPTPTISPTKPSLTCCWKSSGCSPDGLRTRA